MKFFGDIKALSGYELPVVDCITGGSPCQDLSVAGKRAGLDGERSGLFMEQIRIVKEMRENDRQTGRTGHLVRPRYMVWENVPGAFSSNGGKDFQAVLTEIVRIADPEAPDVPMPDKGGWSKSGCLYSDMGDWSIAWRVHDAQYWGVPQRRKRIALVADFGGLSAPEICFERQGLSRDPEPRGAAGKETAGGTGGGTEGAGVGVDVYNQEITGDSVFCLQGNGIDRADTAGCNGRGWCEDVSYTLNTIDRPAVAFGIDQQGGKGGANYSEEVCPPILSDSHGTPHAVAFTQNQRDEVRDLGDVAGALAAEPGIKQQTYVAVYDARYIDTTHADSVVRMDSTAAPLQARDHKGGKLVYDARGNGNGEIAPTITGDHQNRVTDYTAVCVGGGDNMKTYSNQAIGLYVENDKASSIKQRDYKDATDLVVAAVDCRNGVENPDTNGTLQAKSTGGISINYQNVCRVQNVVRRLTPLECERLQGYPDGWTDIGEWIDSKGKRHKDADSPRYKALGNSIALPFWFWLLRRISAQYERPATLGSLFDGIGGFPLCWERCNGRGTALWSSEIEEFPIAVVKRHFGGDA